MTAQELIEALSQLPPDTPIVIEPDDEVIEPITGYTDDLVIKMTLEGEDVFCYDYVPKDYKGEVVRVATLISGNLHAHYGKRQNEIRRQKLREEHRIGALTNDDFDPPL